MIRFLSIWKSGRQKTMLPAITNDRLIIPLPWRGGGNSKNFWQGGQKRVLQNDIF